MLNRVYELETALLRSGARASELKTAVSQAKFRLRQAKITQAEYGGIRAFLDKLSGRYADKAENFSREVRKAEAELSALLRQQEAEAEKLSIVKAQLAALPSPEQLRTAQNAALWAMLETRYCAEVLLPLLERLLAALEEYRQLLRGEIPMLSITQRQEIEAAPIVWVENCRPWLTRLDAAGADVQAGAFFRSPAVFLAAAARHNQLEKAVAADAQTRQLKTHLTDTLQNT